MGESSLDVEASTLCGVDEFFFGGVLLHRVDASLKGAVKARGCSVEYAFRPKDRIIFVFHCSISLKCFYIPKNIEASATGSKGVDGN